jgi:hypothetical protein
MIRSLVTEQRIDNPSDLDAESMSVAMTTSGDLISRDASSFTRVAIGASNTRLASDGSAATWVADTQNTVVDAKGDLMVGSADNTIDRLVVGDDNKILMANSSASLGVSWEPQTDYLGLIIALGG